jgi:hypothetical protein
MNVSFVIQPPEETGQPPELNSQRSKGSDASTQLNNIVVHTSESDRNGDIDLSLKPRGTPFQRRGSFTAARRPLFQREISDDSDSDEDEEGLKDEVGPMARDFSNTGNVNKESIAGQMDASLRASRHSILSANIPSLKRKSNHSLQSGQSMEGHLGKLLCYVDQKIAGFYTSGLYKLIRSFLDSVKWQVVVSIIIQTGVVLSVFVAVTIIMGSKLPSIQLYNLIHAFVSLQGKVVLFFGWAYSQAIARAFLADSMVKSTHGVPLTDIITLRGHLDPARGRMLRLLYATSLVFVEISLWVLSFQMEWTAVPNGLGTFPCIPPTYPVKPKNWTESLGQFLQGDTNLAL